MTGPAGDGREGPAAAAAPDPATVAAHGVRAPSPESPGPGAAGSVPSAEPLYQTSVFDFDSIESSDHALGGRGGYVYSRYGLPNARSLELTVAALEDTDDALATSSGTSAVLGALLACVGAGDTVAVQSDAYGGTIALLADDLARLGIRSERFDATDPGAAAAVVARGAKVVLVETLSNPMLREAPLGALGDVCRHGGAAFLVDNTFATPVLRRPGARSDPAARADLVIHSATKFLGGHHDLCAGVVAGRADLIAKARGAAKRMGFTAAPFDAWLCSRGLKTLGVRVERAGQNADALAAWLRTEPRVAAVHHPGWGAMLSFDLGSGEAASRFVRALELVTLTPSLGGVTTSLSHSATSSHRNFTPEARRALGIGDGLLRLSAGIEAFADIRRDLARGLAAV